MYCVYILHSKKTGKYYIGHTQNIDTRLIQHNKGRVRSTKAGKPWNLLCVELCKTRQQAFRREMQIKAYKGGNAFRKLIAKRVGTEAVNRGRL